MNLEKYKEYLNGLTSDYVITNYINSMQTIVFNNIMKTKYIHILEKLNAFLIKKIIDENEKILTINGITSNNVKSKYKLSDLNDIYYKRDKYGYNVYFSFKNNGVDLFIYNLPLEELNLFFEEKK